MGLKRVFVEKPIISFGRFVERRKFGRKPILIVASPRSGTTLLLSILSAIPSIFAMPKQTYAFDRWQKSEKGESPILLYRLYREILFRKIPVTANRWLEKTPGHIRSLDKILTYFKNDIKIIHIIRDGRDVTVSTHPAYTDKRKYWVEPSRWSTEVRFGLQFRDHHCVYTLFYENLISDFDSEIKKILQFIDEPFTDSIKNWIQNAQIKESIHWGGAVKQIHNQAVGKWQKPEHAERVKEFMNTQDAVLLLNELGYNK